MYLTTSAVCIAAPVPQKTHQCSLIAVNTNTRTVRFHKLTRAPNLDSSLRENSPQQTKSPGLICTTVALQQFHMKFTCSTIYEALKLKRTEHAEGPSFLMPCHPSFQGLILKYTAGFKPT